MRQIIVTNIWSLVLPSQPDSLKIWALVVNVYLDIWGIFVKYLWEMIVTNYLSFVTNVGSGSLARAHTGSRQIGANCPLFGVDSWDPNSIWQHICAANNCDKCEVWFSHQRLTPTTTRPPWSPLPPNLTCYRLLLCTFYTPTIADCDETLIKIGQHVEMPSYNLCSCLIGLVPQPLWYKL